MGLVSDLLEDTNDIIGDVNGDEDQDEGNSPSVSGVVKHVGNVVGHAGAAVSNVLTNAANLLSGPTAASSSPSPSSTPPGTTPKPPANSSPSSTPPSSTAGNPGATSPGNPNDPSNTINPSATHSESLPGSSNGTGTGEGGDATTTSGPPTGTVSPNPVALPHEPDGDEGTAGNSNGSSGNGGSLSGGDVSGNGAGGPTNPSGGTLPGSHGRLSTGAVVGISVVAAALSFVTLVCVVRCLYIRRRRAKRHAWTQHPQMLPPPELERAEREVSWVVGPAAVTPRQSQDSGTMEGTVEGTLESYHSSATSGTNGSLFTGTPPLPSWNRASQTQQRRFQHHKNDSSSNENYGTVIEGSHLSWSSQAPPAAHISLAASSAEVPTPRHANVNLVNGALSPNHAAPNNRRSFWTESSPSPPHSATTSTFTHSSLPTSDEQSSDIHDSALSHAQSRSDEQPARSSTSMSDQMTGAFHSPTVATFTHATVAFPSVAPAMTQIRPAPIPVPVHMIVPSQARPLSPASTSPPTWHTPIAWKGGPQSATMPNMATLSPSQPIQRVPQTLLSPSPEPRTASALYMEVDPFASALDRRTDGAA